MRPEQEAPLAAIAVVVVPEPVVHDKYLRECHRGIHQLDKQIRHAQVDSIVEKVEPRVLQCALDEAAARVACAKIRAFLHVCYHIAGGVLFAISIALP